MNDALSPSDDPHGNGTPPPAGRLTGKSSTIAPAPPGQLPAPDIPGYEVLGELGRGGMGVVYQAREVALKRLVALKIMRPGFYDTPDTMARFRTEAEALARLKHHHVVQIHAIGEYQGRPYLVLEYVEGGSLDHSMAGKPLPPRRAADLALKLTWAVEHLHRHKILHRDLKPANVLLTTEGEPKITDFGLAKDLDGTRLTQTGALLGTPSYMAPEQSTGDGRRIGPATDIYALGAILYEMLTGHPPFQGGSLFDILEQVRTHEPLPPRLLVPDVPRDLEAICLTCLRKEPDRRYASSTDLAIDLQNFLEGRSVRARAGGAWEAMVRHVQRVPLVLHTLVLLVVAISLFQCLFSSVANALSATAAVLIVVMVAKAKLKPLLLGTVGGFIVTSGGAAILALAILFDAGTDWPRLFGAFWGEICRFVYLGVLASGLTAGLVGRGPWPRCMLLPGMLGLVLIYFVTHPEGLGTLVTVTAVVLWFAGAGKCISEYHGSPVWPAIAGSFSAIPSVLILCLMAGFLNSLGLSMSGEVLVALAVVVLAVTSVLGAHRVAKATLAKSLPIKD